MKSRTQRDSLSTSQTCQDLQALLAQAEQGLETMSLEETPSTDPAIEPKSSHEQALLPELPPEYYVHLQEVGAVFGKRANQDNPDEHLESTANKSNSLAGTWQNTPFFFDRSFLPLDSGVGTSPSFSFANGKYYK